MKAWELLEKPGAWTQGADARNSLGLRVSKDSPDAVCWSLPAAIDLCSAPRIKVLEAIAKEGKCIGTTMWNDAPERTQAEVVALLKELNV